MGIIRNISRAFPDQLFTGRLGSPRGPHTPDVQHEPFGMALAALTPVPRLIGLPGDQSGRRPQTPSPDLVHGQKLLILHGDGCFSSLEEVRTT